MSWREILRPELIGLLIPILAILIGGAIAITSTIIKHRERLAMIEQGMDPDMRKPRRGEAASGPEPGGAMPRKHAGS